MLPAIAAAAIPAVANLVGGYLSGERAKDNQAQQMAMQIAFARHGIKWKVEDAKEAGIHPLYALGASTQSYSPVSVGDTSMGPSLAAAGQDISRAINATRTGRERAAAVNSTVQALQLKRMGLENDLLSAQIAKLTQGGGNPPMPDALDIPPKVPVDDPEKTKPTYMGGGAIIPPRDLSPAQSMEDEYGEGVGDTFGLYRFVKMLERETALGRGLHSLRRHLDETLWREQEVARAPWRYRGAGSWKGHF